MVDRIEDLIWGMLFLALALAFSTQNLVHFTLPKLIALRLGTLLLTLTAIYRLAQGTFFLPPALITGLGLALAAWWGVSTLFAVHVPTALNGFWGRYNGLYTQANYLLLFFLAASRPRKTEEVERLLRWFIAAVIPVGLYAVVQFFQLDPIAWATRWSRSIATIGHGVPLGARLSLAVPLALYFLWEAAAPGRKVWGGALLVILLGGLTFSLARGPWLGCAIGLLFLLGFGLVSRPQLLKPTALLTGIVGGLLLGGILLHPEGRGNIGNRLRTFAQLEADPSTIGRLLYYRAAFEAFQDHPLTGIGFENFRTVYPHYRKPLDNEIFSDTIPTMVHNGYLQTVLTNGVPALFFYLALLVAVGACVVTSWQTAAGEKEKMIRAALVASLTGYLIQDLVGWLDLGLTPFFWILLGLTLALASRPENRIPPRKITFFVTGVFLSLSALGWAFLLLRDTRTFRADRMFYEVQSKVGVWAWPDIDRTATAALAHVPDDYYYHDLIGVLAIKQVNENGDPQAYQTGSAALERAHRLYSFDPYVLIHRIDLESKALKHKLVLRRSSFTDQAARQVLRLDKNNPTVYITLARLLIREGEFAEALERIDQATALNPRSRGPREWVAAKQGLFYREIQKGDYESGLKILRGISKQFPDDALTQVLLGKVYLRLGRPEESRASFREALRLDPGNAEARHYLP